MGPQFSLHYVHSPQDPATPDRANGNPLAVSPPLEHQKTPPLTCPSSTLTFCPASNIADGFVVLQRCTLSQQRARMPLRFQESPGVPPSQTGPCPLPGILQTLCLCLSSSLCHSLPWAWNVPFAPSAPPTPSDVTCPIQMAPEIVPQQVAWVMQYRHCSLGHQLGPIFSFFLAYFYMLTLTRLNFFLSCISQKGQHVVDVY